MPNAMFQGRKILLIDDDPTIVAVVGEGLRMRGCKVQSTQQGTQGLGLAKTFQPDLIVLDVVIPDLGGLEICSSLKKDPETARIPIIFLSAKDEPHERVRGLRAGAIDYVPKPFDLDELLARIDIGLRVKSSIETVHEETDLSRPGVAPTDEAAARSHSHRLKIHPNHEFSDLVVQRVEKLDTDSGLLTLVYLRVDQEKLFVDNKRSPLRDKIFNEAYQVLADLAPRETVFGEVDPLQISLLIPRKNKYSAELILDELRNRLGLHDFQDDGEEHRITFSGGVAEYPNLRVANGRQLEELAESALRRAIKQGGDQTILL